jgi:hypothetical protein
LCWSTFVFVGQINTAFSQATSSEQKQNAFTDTNDLLSKPIENAAQKYVDSNIADVNGLSEAIKNAIVKTVKAEANDLLSKAIDKGVAEAVEKIAKERRRNLIITITIVVSIAIGLTFLFYGHYRQRMGSIK